MYFAGKILILAALALIVAPGVYAADEHTHDAAHLVLELDNGERWQTDAPLRKAMEALHETVSDNLHAAHVSTLEDADYAAIADVVDEQIRFMVVNCELPPDADAELHKLIAKMAGASRTMKQGHDRRDGFLELLGALDIYGEYFVHEGWRTPSH